MTALAVVLIGIWLVVSSQTAVSSTLTLVWGIVVAVLGALDLLGWRARVPGPPPG